MGGGMQAPRIAVTSGGANPEKAAHNYVDRLVEAGAEPVLAVPGDDFEALFDTVDGLMLTGGTDIDTYRYGERPVPELLEPDLARDAMEISLLATAPRR